MNYNSLQENYEKDSNLRSNFAGEYILDGIQTNTEKVYPWAPTIIMQKSGGSFVDKKDITDISSELLNITRPNSNVPSEKWMGDNTKNEFIHLRDGLFHQQSTLLNDPPMLLRDQTKNRWINLHQDPQENAIEPFKRNGDNTYLSLIDNYNC
tara:strand:+ start:94 stop:549 length:456 start_codon:yes stop_codon:yes gene_type:complete